jgi:hypothetical protein
MSFLTDRGWENVRFSKPSSRHIFINNYIAINELSGDSLKNMAREDRHIDAAPPPTEQGMLSSTPYMANRCDIIQSILLSTLR